MTAEDFLKNVGTTRSPISGKIAFDTYEEAREELERIVTTKNHKPWKKADKKPCRVYEENGKWYLTSKPIITEISDN